ncbi:hypothetical protein LIER_05838 [Lithospermum erythrorhizon]|uniref:KHA domain-containing protein n=1 Tax=Lithospermum erythrorhizon TaxID=34254 RepID=A0AAV3P3A5_LITER
MLAQGRMDMPLTLCFAAMRGDDLLMNHLLRQEKDPNELDSNGRTALITRQIQTEKILMEVFLCGMHNTKAQRQSKRLLLIVTLLFRSLSRKKSLLTYPKKYQSAPTLPPSHPESMQLDGRGTSLGTGSSKSRLSHQRGSFSKSLFGILSASTPEKAGGTGLVPSSQNRARVVINCPQKGDAARKYILLPDTLKELLQLQLDNQKYDFTGTKILTKDGVSVEDISIIRDGDRIVLANDNNES